jgi:hypothetical protein
MQVFSENHVIQDGVGAVAATLAATNTAVLDMAGHDQVTFLVRFGTIVAGSVITLAVKENTASSTTVPTPTGITLASTSAGVITGGNLVITDVGGATSNKIVAITASRNALSKQYVFLTVSATVANYSLASIIALQDKSRSVPSTQPAAVVAVAQADS